MKNFRFRFIFLLSLILFAIKLNAQDEFRLAINSTFQNVDKTQIPTKYLKEVGYPFLDLNAFNGILNDSGVIDITGWRKLYASFISSYVGTGTPTFPDLSAANTNIVSYESSGSIPVSLLYVNYNDLRPDAVTAGLLTTSNNQIFDVAGRSSSPYRSQTCFAAASSFSESSDTVTKFVFNCDLIFSNLLGKFNGCSTGNDSYDTYTVAIDFANGVGYQNVTMGAIMNVSWASTGIYKIKVKVTTSTGAVVQSWFYFKVNTVSCTNCYVVNPPHYHGIAPNTLHSGGTIEYTTSSTNPYQIGRDNPQFIKPLIFVEGFDAHSVAPHFKSNNYRINDFLAEMNEEIDPRSTFNLNDQLDNIAGYDLIFVDYGNGSDDITRNAELFKEVLRWVNAHKVPNPNNGNITEKNVVFGSSMGGLVTRYGLASMTKNGEITDTRLLITHDSPHRGAVVPLGIQFLLKELDAAPALNFIVGGKVSFKDIAPVIGEAGTIINYGAAKQMLIYRATGLNSTDYVTNTFLADGTVGGYRSVVDFQPSDIQPTYTMNAMSNGSQCGTKWFLGGSSLVSGGGAGFLNPGVALIPGIGQLVYTVFGGTGVFASANINSIPESGVNQLVDFHLHAIVFFLGIPVAGRITDYTINSPSSNVIPYDGAAGGGSPLPTTNGTSAALSTNPLVGGILFAFFPAAWSITSQPYMCFVPTGSALDAPNFIGNSDAINQKFINNFNPMPKISNFSAFVGQGQTNSFNIVGDDGSPKAVTGNFYNTAHIFFNQRNSKWLYENIEANNPNVTNSHQECSTECNPYSIAGPANICDNGGTYYINSGGATVTWTATPTGAVNIQSTSIDAATGIVHVTLVRNNNRNDYLSITASFQSGACTITSVPFNAEVGTVNMPFFNLSGPSSPVCPGGTANFTASIVDPNIQYTWSCISGNCGAVQSSSYGIGHSSNQYSILSNATKGTSFTIKATGVRSNICGTSPVPISSTFQVQIGGSCSSYMRVALSPNPASNTLNIKVEDSRATDTANKIDESFQVTITDMVGNVKYDNKHSTVDTQIDVSNLKTGNYSLRILKSQEVVTQTFSIAR